MAVGDTIPFALEGPAQPLRPDQLRRCPARPLLRDPGSCGSAGRADGSPETLLSPWEERRTLSHPVWPGVCRQARGASALTPLGTDTGSLGATPALPALGPLCESLPGHNHGASPVSTTVKSAVLFPTRFPAPPPPRKWVSWCGQDAPPPAPARSLQSGPAWAVWAHSTLHTVPSQPLGARGHLASSPLVLSGDGCPPLSHWSAPSEMPRGEQTCPPPGVGTKRQAPPACEWAPHTPPGLWAFCGVRHLLGGLVFTFLM